MGATALERTLRLKLQTGSLWGAEVLGLTLLAARSSKSLTFPSKRSQDSASNPSKLTLLGLFPSSSATGPPPGLTSSTALHVSSLSKSLPTSSRLICLHVLLLLFLVLVISSSHLTAFHLSLLRCLLPSQISALSRLFLPSPRILLDQNHLSLDKGTHAHICKLDASTRARAHAQI